MPRAIAVAMARKLAERFKLALAVCLCAYALAPTLSSAGGIGGGGGNMPWDTPLNNLKQDISGPWAAAISLISAGVIIGVLVFGGELPDWGRRMVFLICGISCLVGLATLFTGMGMAGAVI